MDDQAMTTLGTGLNAAGDNGRRNGPIGDDNRSRSDVRSGGDMVLQGVAGFGESLLSLAELQARLAEIELRQTIHGARAGFFLAMGSGLAIFAGLIIILVGVAELLVSEFGIKRGIALVCVAAFAIAAGAGCLALAMSRLRAKQLGFPLSREELARNLNWVRTVFRHSGRARR
jgi:hypothetical protein